MMSHKKIWARSVQPFIGYKQTNKQTPKLNLYIDTEGGGGAKSCSPPSCLGRAFFLIHNENVFYLEDFEDLEDLGEPKTYLVETKDDDEEDYLSTTQEPLPEPGTVSFNMF